MIDLRTLSSSPSSSSSACLEIELPELSERTKDQFTGSEKPWKEIPIKEAVSEKPKSLAVIPNLPQKGAAMAWPAYYKTVNSDRILLDSQKTGFGELAHNSDGSLQQSPLVKVRPEVKVKLDEAQKCLDADPTTSHLQLVVVDGYRTLNVQKQIFLQYKDYLRRTHPDFTESDLHSEAQKMVSVPPENLDLLKVSPPPHSTGASVDVILVDKDKINIEDDFWLNDAMVDFGASFDEMMHPEWQDRRSETRFYENTNSSNEPAKKHRRLLYHLLTSLGFSNYHNEFWHFDLGNQFDAASSGRSEARYGFAGGIQNDQIVEDLSHEERAFDAYRVIAGEVSKEVRHHFGL